MTRARVYLVDASPYIFRAHFALPASIRDRTGRSVNAVYGFTGFLLKLLDDEAPTHLGVAFDGSLTTSFRNEIFPEYKAHREPPPVELEEQLEDCRNVAAALGAATFVDERFEADDLIGTVAAQIAETRADTVVVTSDKDLSQLVADRVSLLDFAKGEGERLDVRGVRDRLGVDPRQVVDLLALAGDPVDNIPGVAGIGPKTACRLLEHFADLETIYDSLDAVTELPLRGAASIRRKLEAGRDVAFLSRTLAEIARNAPIRVDLEDLLYDGADASLVDPLVDRLGFEGIRGRILQWKT